MKKVLFNAAPAAASDKDGRYQAFFSLKSEQK
jgi:hypothetical protein